MVEAVHAGEDIDCTYDAPRQHKTITNSSKHEVQSHKLQRATSTPALFNVDSELLHLQRCLQVPSGMTPFQIAVPGRHVVYSGELCYVDGWKWMPSWVVLFNDVLLVTHRETPEYITVLTEPIHMRDVIAADFECIHRK